MNFPTLVILAILAVIVIADIRYLKRNGIDQCGGNCAGCGTSCKWVGDMKKAQRHIARERKIRQFFHLDRA
ncbi:MAG: FeoB-associated Cys-rich membrane protein [Erysipelotrichaceae bacterium]|nr:FeoB-associated Cys-rich membrane protein [Erysipelotrichaceae bacterium]